MGRVVLGRVVFGASCPVSNINYGTVRILHQQAFDHGFIISHKK